MLRYKARAVKRRGLLVRGQMAEEEEPREVTQAANDGRSGLLRWGSAIC